MKVYPQVRAVRVPVTGEAKRVMCTALVLAKRALVMVSVKLSTNPVVVNVIRVRLRGLASLVIVVIR